jgi:hypothetical protein
MSLSSEMLGRFYGFITVQHPKDCMLNHT